MFVVVFKFIYKSFFFLIEFLTFFNRDVFEQKKKKKKLSYKRESFTNRKKLFSFKTFFFEIFLDELYEMEHKCDNIILVHYFLIMQFIEMGNKKLNHFLKNS